MNIKTPCYIIDEKEYLKNISQIMSSFNKHWSNNVIFGYSIKTNHYPYFIKIAKKKNWYAEAVSTDEYNHAIELGYKQRKIIFNGPVKGEALKKAIKEEGIVNIDNFDELAYICKNKKFIKCKLGLRVNLDLEKYVPGETTVKNEGGRFGISYENGDLLKALKMLKDNGLKLNGLHLHHSSSTRSLKVFTVLSKKAIEIAQKYDLNDLDYIDIGGGYFGGNYFKGKPKIDDYAKTITKQLKKFFDSKKITLIIEPGAAILATSCDYLTSVVNIRCIERNKIVTVDGSCLHINPFMKNHQQNPCEIINPEGKLSKNEVQIIGGSTCMEMDRLYPMKNIYRLGYKSKLLFHCAGAYTLTHNSSFINLPPNIYVKRNNKYTLSREKNVKLMSY